VSTQDCSKVATALERLAAQGAATRQIAVAVVATWHAINDALAPVIGGKGVEALYGRSLYLVREAHPWLAALSREGNGGMDLVRLAAALEQQDSFTAAGAAGDQFVCLCELLRSLIGPSLTGQLLRSAWDNPLDGPPVLDRTP
jgi:hypothetical protein